VAVDPTDTDLMQRAIEAAATARTRTAPNPWVGSVILTASGSTHAGATQPPGGAHAEIEALRSAGEAARGSTLVTTLEPCAHHGRTGPCTEAIIDAGVSRVVVALEDPDPQVAGSGIARLRNAGIIVDVGAGSAEVEEQLASYLHHRRTGRPYVVLKLAATLDGRTAAPDGSSQWITGEDARRNAHQLRAESQAILVGAGTVRADNPTLTTRLVDGPSPRRVVLGHAPADAAVHPCLEWVGSIPDLLDQLGSVGTLQLMIEGGASVAAEFHDAGLVDRYILYLAPTLFGGDDARPLFIGDGTPTMADLRRGTFLRVEQIGDDIRVDLRLEKSSG
jgi:diaminohydroxyphosphoribosylaminopyrimidine deaminase / 5-amino-6-(5-phosphoribosylamino)uracil reductase